MADILLKTEHLSKSFGGVKAVQDFNMELHEGEVGGIIGPNGAGKTTIFNLLSHIYDYSEGRVTFLGRDITESDQVQVARMGLSRTFQNTRLFAGLSVLDNVKVGLDQAGRYNLFEAMFLLPRRQREERRIAEEASRCLEVLNLSQHSGARPANLPYGIQRRVEIARAIASRPRRPSARRAGRRAEPGGGFGSDRFHPSGSRSASSSPFWSLNTGWISS